MSIEKKYTLNRITVFIISLIGFIGTAITIYAFFTQQRKVELQYQITSNTNVLDIKADVHQLDILFDGKSLKSNNENVRIITLKIANNGNTDILKNFYDEKDPLGLKIKNGHLLKEPEMIDASNDYIKKNLKISFDSSGTVLFSSIILESGEYYTIKMLLIHTVGTDPIIIPIGKIAGVKDIVLVNTIESKETESFYKKVFSGNLLTQLVRGFVYTLIVILIIIAVAFLIDKVSNYRAKNKRKTYVDNFMSKPGYVYNRMDDAIFNKYINVGDSELSRMIFVLNNSDDFINRIYNMDKNSHDWGIDELLKDGIIIKENDSLIINKPMLKTLKDFLNYLKDNE